MGAAEQKASGRVLAANLDLHRDPRWGIETFASARPDAFCSAELEFPADFFCRAFVLNLHPKQGFSCVRT
jgi:hypothetical protein